MCNVSDSSRVTLSLHNLDVIPVNQVARFHMTVDDNSSAELAVSVRGLLHASFGSNFFGVYFVVVV